MNKIFESTDISFFKVNNGKLYFKNNKGIWIWGEKNELLFDDKNSSNMLFNHDNFVVLDNLNNPTYYSNGLFDKLKQVSNIRISKIVDNYVIYYIKRPQYLCGLFDLKTEDFFEFDKNYFEYYFKPNFYSTLGKKITCLTINTLPLWNYTLPEREYSQGSNYPSAVSKEIVNILGVYGGIVWIINNIGHLIGLDSETGKCKYYLKTPVNIPTEWGNWEVFVNAKKSFIDTEKGIIFGLDHVYYWECDLNNPTESYLLYDVSETSKEHSIVPDLKGNWLGEEIFFGQNSFAQDPGFAGIFNRKTRQITWTSRELGDEGVFKGINKIEYQAGRLYVLDRASTLHIFERE